MFDRTVMEGVVATVKMVEEQIKTLPRDEQEAALAEVAGTVQASMPPRENPRLNTSLDSVYASGPLGRAHCVIHGNCNYKQTGLLQAYLGLLAAAAAAEAGRLRLRLPGIRAPRTARCAAQLRAGDGARTDRPPLTVTCCAATDPSAMKGDYDAAERLSGQGRIVGRSSALPDDGRARSLSYGEVQALSFTIARALRRTASPPAGRWPSCRPTIRSPSPASSGSPGPAPCGARSTRATRPAENRDLLAAFDCTCLIYQQAFAPLVEQILPDLPN